MITNDMNPLERLTYRVTGRGVLIIAGATILLLLSSLSGVGGAQ